MCCFDSVSSVALQVGMEKTFVPNCTNKNSHMHKQKFLHGPEKTFGDFHTFANDCRAPIAACCILHRLAQISRSLVLIAGQLARRGNSFITEVRMICRNSSTEVRNPNVKTVGTELSMLFNRGPQPHPTATSKLVSRSKLIPRWCRNSSHDGVKTRPTIVSKLVCLTMQIESQLSQFSSCCFSCTHFLSSTDGSPQRCASRPFIALKLSNCSWGFVSRTANAPRAGDCTASGTQHCDRIKQNAHMALLRTQDAAWVFDNLEDARKTFPANPREAAIVARLALMGGRTPPHACSILAGNATLESVTHCNAPGGPIFSGRTDGGKFIAFVHSNQDGPTCTKW